MRYRPAFVSGVRVFHRGDIKSATAIRLCGRCGLPPQGVLCPTRAIRGKQPLWQCIAARTSRLGSMLGTGRGDPAR